MKAIHFSLKTWLQTNMGFCAVLILASCSNSQIKKEFIRIESGQSVPEGIEMIYPFNGTIFPPEFPAPDFEWKDTTFQSSQWSVFISDTQGKVLFSNTCYKNSWKPDSIEWNHIKKIATEGYCNFTAIADKGKNSYSTSCRIQFSVSSDSVGADIFYRAVPLPFSYAVKNVGTIEWYLGSVNGSKPRKMLDHLPVCGNCHSFASDQPLLAMDVDYANDKGSYVIAGTEGTSHLTPENIITWSDYKRDDDKPTFGLLSQISPNGNYVLSTVKDLSIFVAVDDNLAYSQLFFPIKGIIGIYDRKNKAFDALNGANDEKYVQSNPVWSPDNKKIIFAKTEAYVNEKARKAGRALLTVNDITEFTTGGKQFKYDLYSMDFNDGKGGLASPLKGASNNGKSNYFPKFSPDGKWIVFCQADNFMLLQPDSRLFIMPAEGGSPRLMNCNMPEMNSWHSFSPNGRWLVFSSKNRGPYTQLYLTHIDENGMDSPPVLLENLRFDKRAANIPEFYPFDADQFKTIKDGFSNTTDYLNRGAVDKISNRYYKRALDDLNKAIEIDSNCLETYISRIMLNNLLRQSNSKVDRADKKKAMALVLDSLAQNPDNEIYLSSRISLLSNMGNTEEALKEANLALKKHPNSYKLYDLVGSIYRKENQMEKAIECYQKMQKIDPRNKVQLNNMTAGALIKLNQNEKALQLIRQTIKDYPNEDELINTRAQILLNQKKTEQAKKDIDRLLASDSTNFQYNELLAQYHLNQGNKSLYVFQKRKNLALLTNLHRSNKEDIELLFEMASIHMALKDYQNAEIQYNLILSTFPNNYEALKEKAKIKLSRQNWSEAISIYDQLESIYPLEEGFCNNKAIAYIQIGNYTKALAYFDQTIKLNPSNKDAIFNRNKLRSEQGKH
ncbi:MAG: tetratricopeptide repeat protein [Prolixibacteraceae bacterium]